MQLDAVQASARLIFGLCSLALVGIIIGMIRKNVIREKYVLLWLPLGLGFFAFSLFPDLLVKFSARVHLHYMTVVVLVIIVVFTNILLYFTVRMSQLREDVKKLSQEIALARARASDTAQAPPLASTQGWTPAPKAAEHKPDAKA